MLLLIVELTSSPSISEKGAHGPPRRIGLMLTVTSGKKKQEVSSNTSFSCSLSLMPVSVVAGLCIMPSLLHERLLLPSCSSRDVKHTCVLFFLSSFQPVPRPHEMYLSVCVLHDTGCLDLKAHASWKRADR